MVAIKTIKFHLVVRVLI